MAVNTMDKLHFLSFIFAVLLSNTVHFIALRPESAIVHQHSQILLKSVQMFWDIYFSVAIRHYVEFLKGQNFIWRRGLET